MTRTQTPPQAGPGRPAADHFTPPPGRPPSLPVQAVEAMAIGLVITDAARSDNPIVYCNPGFERLTGFTAAEIVGRNCRFLQGDDTDTAELDRLRAAIRAGQPCSVVLRNYRKDRTPFWNALSVNPIADAAGRVTHFVGVQTDITAVRDLEAQFLQSQKMEVIGLLAGGIAHDFNNLLTVINGFGEVVRDMLPPADPARGMIEEVVSAGERAAGLTRQLLTFSRKEAPEPAAIDLNAVVGGCERMLRRLLGPKVELTDALDPTLSPVLADAGQVEQVVVNLAVNARDAMPGGGTLTVATTPVKVAAGDPAHPGVAPGNYAVLRVTDTGHGMDAATLARVFEPFFTTKPAGRGTGLGLSTVTTIVRGVRGHVRVESEVGVGTTFHVYLPRAEVGMSRVVRTGLAGPRRGTEVILVVDDEPAVRVLMAYALRALGYTVLEAATGAEGLAVVAAHPGPVHLAVTDVMMPGLPADRFAAELRAARPGVGVLFVSGYVGGDPPPGAFLQKPFTPAALTAKVRAVLDAG